MGAGGWKWVMRAAFVACLAQGLYYRDKLPESVATHFDLAGNPDGYSSTASWFWFHVVLAGSFLLLFEGIGFMIRRLPAQWINLPNRDYWLAPERRDETLGYIEGEMGRTGMLTLAFVFGIGQLVVDANLKGEGRLDNTWFFVLIGLYLLAMVHMCVRLFRRFPKAVDK